ncbi:hypothetical protein CfE428DRAFT_4223 [Chthoniobacter flavus Ellin428]|uniref:Uncharacterized protein n=1 Tax=Chthoniobacter flavus Ellin428 TaxID=497964 RepID=B4D5N4_9BACT|nr:DUF6600 domain-containing protein [Chthoniobacter flavus]EDY18439.1 hypothetical protein CfE428DRAFT_4223 [Chthoniobacter flavus Ellin428]TCO90852.1 hypothetical protein EV701_1091 [Chthoniobacter flavus]
MKYLLRAVMTAALAVAAAQAHAGTLFYVGIPGNGSDAGSGITTSNVYTAAAGGGNAPGGLSIGGVPFTPLVISGNSATAAGLTLSAATGTLAAGGGKSASIEADGSLGEVLSRATFNQGADNGSEQYLVLDPATLQAGKTYDLRVYFCNPSGQNRQIDLAFAGDGQPAVATDFFNEDDATTSPGGFTDANQVYYVDYRFTWDGSTSPGVTVTQRSGSTPFSFYALTNQEVAGPSAALPPGAVAEGPSPVTPGAIRTDAGVEDDTDQSDVGISSDVFYGDESLQRNGHWVEVGSYGRCWQPNHVDENWSPYTVGHWVYASDGGWTWDSDEDWGWATYHYGRWCHADNGWFWTPGRVWAPSWCSWRFGGGHVGWAPLPPEAGFSANVGIGGWADNHYGLGPQAYNFVSVRDFGAPQISRVIIQRQQNVNIIQKTTNVTNITNNNHVVYAGGPSLSSINNTLTRGGGRPFSPVVIQRNTALSPVGAGGRFVQKGNVLAIAGPKIVAGGKATRVPKVTATIPATKLDKGWAQIKDPKLAAQLKTKIASESNGLTPQNAPARPLGQPIVNGEQKPGQTPHRPGETIAKPGQTIPGETPGKPNQSPRKPGETIAKPGQTIPGEAPGKPNQSPRKPGETIEKPGQTIPGEAPGKPNQPPRKPGEVIEKPGQTIPGEAPGKPNQPLRKPGEVIAKPGQTIPGEAPGKPNQPPRKPGETIEKPGQTIPGEAPGKPNQPPRKPGETIEKPGQTIPGEAPGKPNQPPRKPAEAEKPAPPEKKPEKKSERPAQPQQPIEKPEKPAKPQKPERPPKEEIKRPQAPVEPMTKRPPAEAPKEKRPEQPVPKPPEERPREGKHKEPAPQVSRPETKEAPKPENKSKEPPKEGNKGKEGDKGKGKGKATPEPH